MHSAIYTGQVWHRREQPAHNEFTYQVYMAYLDLAELDEVMSLGSWWGPSVDGEPNRRKSVWPAVQFCRSDFFNRDDCSLDWEIRDWVARKTGARPEGPIRMLANLRTFGFIINPIVCYYLFDQSGDKLRYVIAEVTNTPWRERIQYLLPVDETGNINAVEFDKAMHVSPFHDMAMNYRWSSNHPEQILRLTIENIQRGESIFKASMHLQRIEISANTLRRVCLRFPLMCFKVGAAIYWQAFKLFLKRVPLVPHPKSKVRNG